LIKIKIYYPVIIKQIINLWLWPILAGATGSGFAGDVLAQLQKRVIIGTNNVYWLTYRTVANAFFVFFKCKEIVIHQKPCLKHYRQPIKDTSERTVEQLPRHRV